MSGDELLVEYSLFNVRRIVKGLRSPRDSGEHKLAVLALTRLFGPAGISLLLSLFILGALAVLLKSRTIEFIKLPPVWSREKGETLKPEDRDAVERELDKNMDRTALAGPGPVADFPAPADDGPLPPAPASPAPDAPAIATIGGLAPVKLKGPALKSPFDNRFTPGSRKKASVEYDAPDEADERVLAALRWLKKKQDPDGSWKTASDVDATAMTGLAVLAFLGHGETPDKSPEFGPALEKGLRHLLSIQKPNGSFSSSSYTHAIVTYALAEAFALTKIMEVRDAMEKGVAFLITGQQDAGGFDYSYAKAARFDTSVAGWNIQALKAARLAGCRHPGLETALERCVFFLKTQAYAQNGSGFVYEGAPGAPSASGGRWSMTGVGTLGLQVLGHSKDPETRQGLACLEPLEVQWPAAADAKPALYGWYYVTQAKFHKGESAWKKWNSRFSRPYIDRQVREPDGCGYWPTGDHGGAVYATTLATLTLEVYYRYLPTYGLREETVTAYGKDDVTVEVL